jgi:hypothetical protein
MRPSARAWAETGGIAGRVGGRAIVVVGAFGVDLLMVGWVEVGAAMVWVGIGLNSLEVIDDGLAAVSWVD